MANAARQRTQAQMSEQTFTCSECGQQISVNDAVRSAILDNGCPVCTASATEADFDE
jgi:transcription elongation factor Elf1